MTLVDTSAFFALLNSEDPSHRQAGKIWNSLLDSATPLFTSNYIVLESSALLQNRIGFEAVQTFVSDLLPLVEVQYIDPETHSQALSSFLAARRRKLSLVDCSSFALIRSIGAKSAFAFDRHFRDEGFHLSMP
jgi:uncharacterized protein